MNTTKIIQTIIIEEIKQIIYDNKEKITISPHALDHLSNAQRKIFDKESLLRTILTEEPRFAGLQRNGRYALFYRRTEGYLKLILENKANKLDIITFINTDNMPNITRKNEN